MAVANTDAAIEKALWCTVEVLKKHFGYSSFRKGKEEMVDFLLSGIDALAIMPTRKLKISMVAVD